MVCRALEGYTLGGPPRWIIGDIKGDPRSLDYGIRVVCRALEGYTGLMEKIMETRGIIWEI